MTDPTPQPPTSATPAGIEVIKKALLSDDRFITDLARKLAEYEKRQARR